MIVGMSGASGVPVAIEFLHTLKIQEQWESHLIISDGAKKTISAETDFSYREFAEMADFTYTTDDDDTWRWFHYSQYLSSTLIHSSHSGKIRICEVEPLGRTNKFRCMSDGYNKGFYYTTDKLFIVRELVEDEVLVTVEKEKCPLWMVLKYL